MPDGSGQVKPGVIALRPLRVGEILDGALATIRRHPVHMLGVAAIVVLVSQVLISVATYPLLDNLRETAAISPSSPPAEVNRFLRVRVAYDGITALIALPSRVLLAGLLTIVIGKAVLGQPLERGELWARVRSRLLALLAVSLIYPAITVGAGAVIYGLTLSAAPVSVLVILAAVPVAIWLYILFSFATPALMLENAPVARAFGRSRTLVRGSWWRVFGIQLLAALIALVVGVVLSFPFQVGDNLALSTTGAIIAGTLTEPFAAAVTVLVYTDQRMRCERMDLDLARAAGRPPLD
jgi:hypothetical protein